ncbi:GNAT family N-acetyltransferase [Bacillus pinisoli]|uniref:GNAT family N-acetyltransferase n=1 Tax=Bacillus pinisoli TaxID=2901866 RepID=UPI001FF1B173|nr:GNAT family N-acetyltransferase [Bacillus pinisoli]
MYDIRSLTSLDEIKQVQSIEEQVWNTQPIPDHQIYTVIHNGGILLGAYDGDQLIGFLYSFPGYKNGMVYLCSHMLGILPSYRKGGLGERMKKYQLKLAKSMGYTLITWTFDPLESVNAYLNIHKLQGITESYLENHYGNLNDSLNQGLPTDRFIVEWWINSTHVNETRMITTKDCKSLLQTRVQEAGLPVITSINNNKNLVEECYIVPIPDDFQGMKRKDPELAIEWRLRTRMIFQQLFSSGYVAVNLERKSELAISNYLFVKKENVEI